MNKRFWMGYVLSIGFLGIGMGEAATLRFLNVPTDTFEEYDRFVVDIEVDLSNESSHVLTGAYFEVSSSPAGILRVVSMQAGTASAEIFKASTGPRRVVWAHESGRIGSRHEIVEVEFEVLPDVWSETATLEINPLEIRGQNFALLSSLATSASVSLLATAPPPTVTVTPNPTGSDSGNTEDGADNRTENAAVSSSGGCSSTNSLNVWNLFILTFAFLPFLRKRRNLRGMMVKNLWLLGFVFTLCMVSNGWARIIEVNSAAQLEAAFEQRFVAGDVIELASGTYSLSETIEISPAKNGSGFLGVPIIMRGATGNPDDVVLQSNGKAILGLMNGLSYWVFENLSFVGGGPWVDSTNEVVDPSIIAGKKVSYGIVIRNNVFSGSILGSSNKKTAIFLNTVTPIPSFDQGHYIEENTFDNVAFREGSNAGFAYMELFSASHSVVRGNRIEHLDRAMAPYHFLSLNRGGKNLIERNFFGGFFRGVSTSEGLMIRYQNPGSMIRNNILFFSAGEEIGTPSNDVPMAAIYIAEGSSNVRSLIHNNSIRIEKEGGDDHRVVAHIYSDRFGMAAYLTNNVFVSGDFMVSGAWWSSDAYTPNDRINLDTNFIFDTLATDELAGPDEWRHYIFSSNEIVGGASPFVGGGVMNASSYELTGSTPAQHSGATSLNRCSTLDGSTTNCDSEMGASGGATPYDSTTMFSYCGPLNQLNRPDRDLDRTLELEDVLHHMSSNPTLANELASYLSSFNRTDLSCF